MSGAERMEAVLEGLLLLARADAGGEGGVRERVDLTTLATEVVDELQPPDGPNVRVEGAASALVSGDVIQLDLLIRNLVSNAIRHTPESGDVVVHVALGEHVVLEVRDTGEGIAAEALPRIFERFFRADAARDRPRGGAGLGLSIVQTVVHQHGGAVEAESTPGVGTIVRARLPRAAREVST